MTTENFLFRQLEKSFNTYSKSQKILARLIIEHYQKVAFLTIKGFADLSGTSEATIVRFIKRLGFSGYPDFQKEVRRLLRSDLKGHERFEIASEIKKTDRDPVREVIEKEFENLSHLQKSIDPAGIRNAVSAIKQANEIIVIGTRASASLACHFSFGLSKLNFRTTRILNVNSELFDMLDGLENYPLVIIIGFPRYLNDLLDILDFCRKRQIKTMVLTDSPFSPLTGDINLYMSAESSSFIAFYCAPMVVINTIVIELSLLNKQTTLNTLNRFEKLAENKNYFYRS